MAIDYDTPDEQWPQKGRGGFMRNYHGQAVVSHPDGGKRTLIYEGASSLLEFANPYTGDPIHGERGSHIHSLCDLADQGQPLPPDFIAAGEAIGITAELQAYIYARWIVFRKAHGLTAVAIEATVVNDDWKVATNIDRVDHMGDAYRTVKATERNEP